jgi:hypothetical protein
MHKIFYIFRTLGATVSQAVVLSNLVSLYCLDHQDCLERALVKGNAIQRLVADRCVIEVSIGKHIGSIRERTEARWFATIVSSTFGEPFPFQ